MRRGIRDPAIKLNYSTHMTGPRIVSYIPPLMTGPVPVPVPGTRTSFAVWGTPHLSVSHSRFFVFRFCICAVPVGVVCVCGHSEVLGPPSQERCTTVRTVVIINGTETESTRLIRAPAPCSCRADGRTHPDTCVQLTRHTPRTRMVRFRLSAGS